MLASKLIRCAKPNLAIPSKLTKPFKITPIIHRTFCMNKETLDHQDTKYEHMLNSICKKYEFNKTDPFPVFEISMTFKFFLWIVNFQLLGLTSALIYFFYQMVTQEEPELKQIQDKIVDTPNTETLAHETKQEIFSSEDGKTKIKLGKPRQDLVSSQNNKILGVKKDLIPFLFIPPFLILGLRKNLQLRRQFPKQILLYPESKQLGLTRYGFIGSSTKVYDRSDLELRSVKDKKGRTMKNFYLKAEPQQPMLIGASGTWIDKELFEYLVKESV